MAFENVLKVYLKTCITFLIFGITVRSNQVILEHNSEINDIKKLALINNEFGIKLHQSFDSSGNAFTSPVSIFTALAMLYKGTNTSTAREMREVLSYDVLGSNDVKLHQTFKALLELIQSTPEEYQLEMANALICQSKYHLLQEFHETLEKSYHALHKEVDFVNERENAVQEINNWVKEKTKGKITKLLDEEIDALTRVILLNAVYFKGLWKKPFDPELTFKSTFYNNGVKGVEISAMPTEGKFLFKRSSDIGFDALSLPYIGDDVSMLILLPLDRNGLGRVEKRLTASLLNRVISEMIEHKVSVTIPKFKLEDSRSLKDSLEGLGIKKVFSEQTADLSGINGHKDLYVTAVVHKAVVEVNEKGSEAAGATGIVIGTRISGIRFLCDHPFLFLIRDNRTGMILFLGRVNEL